MTAAEQIPCVDETLEARYLAAVMQDGDVLEQHPIWPRELWSKRHRAILEAVYALRSRSESTDSTSVALELDRRGQLKAVGGAALVDRMSMVAELFPGPLAQRIRELHAGRALRERAMRIVALVETDLAEAHREAREAADTKLPGTETAAERFGTLRDAVRDAIGEIRTRAERGRPSFVKTGIATLDEMIGGVEYGDLTVIGGDTSVGKSSTALLMACAMARAGHRPGIISCEDAAPRVGRRVLSMLSGVPVVALRKGDMTPWQWEALEGATVTVDGLSIELAYCIGEDVERVTEATRTLIAERGCDIVFLDYVQAVSVKGQDERIAMRTVLSSFKRECNRAKPPASGVVLSQMRRRDDMTVQPKRSQLYESGYLEQKADTIILLWKDADGVLNGVLDKAKDDATGVLFSLTRNPRTGLLEENR
jgi:replicative DNA helicase